MGGHSVRQVRKVWTETAPIGGASATRTNYTVNPPDLIDQIAEIGPIPVHFPRNSRKIQCNLLDPVAYIYYRDAAGFRLQSALFQSKLYALPNSILSRTRKIAVSTAPFTRVHGALHPRGVDLIMYLSCNICK